MPRSPGASSSIGVETTRRGRAASRRQSDFFESLDALFVAEGFLHLTLDEIAARLRCSKSTLYRLAPSKDELVVAVMQWHYDRAASRLETELTKLSTAKEKLEYFIAARRELVARYSQPLTEDIHAFGPTRQLWEQAGARLTARLSALISAGIENGEFEDVSPLFIGFLLGYLSDGIQRGIATKVTGLPPDKLYDAMLDTVFRALDTARPQHKITPLRKTAIAQGEKSRTLRPS